jgi:hypothetical protein
VWLTIAQGVAQHVRLNAEALRSRIVRHHGKQRLSANIAGGMPTDAASWRSAVGTFRAQLGAEIGEGPARLFECDFSTSNDIDRVASQIVLLDAYSPYFSLWMTCVCGIPTVTLTGTVDDWRHIRERVDVIAELDLELWCKSLRPIADHFVRAAAGDADVAFWKRIYNPIDAYGGEIVTGWITRFYPYLKANGIVNHKNAMLDLKIDEPSNVPKSDGPFYSGPGLRTDMVPDTLSRVIVHVVDRTTGENRDVALHGGVIGVAQDHDGSLRPISGWYLDRATITMAAVVDRIVDEYAVEKPQRELRGGPADLVALNSRVGRVVLPKITIDREFQHERIQPIAGKHLYPHKVAELEDGRALCYLANDMRGDLVWFACYITHGRVADALTDVPTFGSSLAALLGGALDANGEIDHMTVGSLADIVARG